MLKIQADCADKNQIVENFPLVVYNTVINPQEKK
jgi:hypothetical protein